MAGTKDLSEELRLVLKPLEGTGIPVQTWTTTELARHFITAKSFIGNVKKITLISSNVVRDNVMSLAIQRGFWTENHKCTPTAMMKFCSFLNSKQGSEILDDFQKKVSLSTHVFIHDIVYAAMLMRQLSEFDAARKGRTSQIEADIAYHRHQIMLLEKQLAKETVEVESRYVPASQYVPLDEQKLLKRCYNKYVAEGIENGEMLRKLDQELIEFIKSKYEEEVPMLHISDFLVDEKRKLVFEWYVTYHANKASGF